MKRVLSSLALCMALSMQPAQADFIGDCTKILNGAQHSFKDLFPTAPDNLFLDHWCFREYPGPVYLGFTLGNSDFPPGVHGLNGIFGDTPSFIATRDEAFALLGLDSGGGGDLNAICDSSNSAVSGIKTIQDGKNITITTEGCVKLPTRSLCEVRPATDEQGTTQTTDYSVLTVTDLISYNISGLLLPSIPGLPNPLDPILQSFETTVCHKNAPKEMADTNVQIDVCFDISEQFVGIPGIPDEVTVEFKASSSSTLVDDCANTDADTIIDLFTGAVL